MSESLDSWPEQLAGVVAKFHRAKEQFDELTFERDAFFNQEPKPYFARGEFDSDAWEWIERLQVREAPPLRLGVILGDVLHNLRSALDHLMWQVTLLDGGTPDDSTQFPIASKNEAQFDGMANRMVPGLSAEHLAFVKGQQPYHARDDPEYGPGFAHGLGILATLSNQDKHQVVLPTYCVLLTDPQKMFEDLRSAYERSPSPGAPIKGISVANPGQRVKHGTGLIRLIWDRGEKPPRDVQVPAHFTLGITFGEIGFDARDLPNVALGVKTIMQRFRADF